MSDIEGEREGDRAHDGSGTDPIKVCLDNADKSLAYQTGFSPITPAVRELIRAVEILNRKVRDLQTDNSELRETLQTYMKRSAPALSAARMHIPIGGGDTFWRRERDRKEREKTEEAKKKLAAKTVRRK